MGVWADELCSGDYQQGYYRLFDGLGYCCLGVRLKMEGSNFSGMDDVFKDEMGAMTLPNRTKIREWGLDKFITSEERITLLIYGLPRSELRRVDVLSYLNDNHLDFPEIANLLKRLGWDNSKEE